MRAGEGFLKGESIPKEIPHRIGLNAPHYNLYPLDVCLQMQIRTNETKNFKFSFCFFAMYPGFFSSYLSSSCIFSDILVLRFLIFGCLVPVLRIFFPVVCSAVSGILQYV